MNMQPATVTAPVNPPPAPKAGPSPNGDSPNGSPHPSREEPCSHKSTGQERRQRPSGTLGRGFDLAAGHQLPLGFVLEPLLVFVRSGYPAIRIANAGKGHELPHAVPLRELSGPGQHSGVQHPRPLPKLSQTSWARTFVQLHLERGGQFDIPTKSRRRASSVALNWFAPLRIAFRSSAWCGLKARPSAASSGSVHR